MSSYPSVSSDRTVEAQALLDRVTAVFQRCGMPGGDARLLADSLVMADVRGVHSHGVLRVPEYVNKLTGGGVDPQGRPRVVEERGAAMVVDGANSMGQIACDFGMQQAVDRASHTGVAVAVVRGSNHCGAMFYFAMKALTRDMIGLAATNALPTMAPWAAVTRSWVSIRWHRRSIRRAAAYRP